VASYDPREVHSEASKAGFRPEVYEKTLRLLGFLAEVDEHPELKGRLILRGGTAINLFLAKLPRMSVDADFNYIGREDREGMIKERPQMNRWLRDVARTLGYEVRDTHVEGQHALDQFLVRYRNVLGQGDSLKIETNYIMRVPLVDPERRKAALTSGDSVCEFTLAGTAEIYAGKVKALVERCAPRDMFDVHRLVSGGELKLDPIMRGLIVALLGTVGTENIDVRRLTIDAVSWPSERSLRDELLPMLRSTDGIDAATLRGTVRPLLEELFRHTPNETEFLKRVAEGSIDGNLIFPDDREMAGRINRHPAIRWRAQHPSPPPRIR
jgi:hypothetical protein